MSVCCSLFRASIGKKTILAISGFFLFGFIIAHLIGNLLIFMGPDAINAYALKLQHLSCLLWIARIVLLTFVIAHIATAIQITIENRKARPERYIVQKTIGTTYAARTMMFSGFIVLGYIIFHLLHFTFKTTHPEISNFHDSLGRHDVYSMVVLSFQQPLLSFIYIFSTALLCMHLSHGLASLLQTLGIGGEKATAFFKKISCVIALFIFVGYSSIPIAALTGYLKAPNHAKVHV